MTITLSNTTIGADAPWGRVIGTFNAGNVRLLHDQPGGYFGITGNTLRVAWHGMIATPGVYPIEVKAPGGESATFNITVTAPATAPPPSPPSVAINGSTGPATVSVDGPVAATVANGPGTPGDWLGVFAGGQPSDQGHLLAWKWLATDKANSMLPRGGVTGGTVHFAAPPALGLYEVRFFANNGWTATATSAAITVVKVAAPPPPPPPPPPPRVLVMSLSPAAPSIEDSAPPGTVLATATVRYSDGSVPAVVSLTSSDPTFVAVRGMSLVTARALTSADVDAAWAQTHGGDPAHHVTITASDGLGASVTARVFGR